ncbi:protein cycle isoform X2 [Pararge aegeria]|uniref:protein cycle isoform X2 n=1 Tax=Pararge aegeria TaxID=116150 RepID=UPI0019D207C6|nr:protein cycle isoform X2 [Pararge aegeria]
MSREFPRVNEFYYHLQDLQPPTPHYTYPFELPHTSTQPAYELTVGAGVQDASAAGFAEVAGAGALLSLHAPLPHLQHPLPLPLPAPLAMPLPVSQRDVAAAVLKRSSSQNISDGFELTNCEVITISSTSDAAATRKRKPSPYSTCSTYDDDGNEDSRSNRSTLPDKRQNHSEIEKRRRDKMNNYITELSSMIPMCTAIMRKLDKLTVLRMAVQHMKSIRGAMSAGPLSVRPKPTFLSDRALNGMVLEAAKDCFVMVVSCSRGRLLYVSASVTNMLQYDKAELLGQSLFDILHPKDVAKVKEQLSSSDLSPRERLIDAKTMLPVKSMVSGASRLCAGARRSFFCRIKCRPATVITATSGGAARVKEEHSQPKARKLADKKYCVVQCTGYLKSWAPANISETGDGAADESDCNLSCLVAVGRCLADLTPLVAPAPHKRSLAFASRHTTDSKFVFVDQRVTLVLGYLPQELLGTSLYEHVSAPELGAVAKTHKTALLQRNPLKTPPYSFKKKDGTYVRIQTHFKPFNNPWTKDVECLIANNTVVTEEWAQPAARGECYDMYNRKADLEMQRLIDSQVESHKIGSTIVQEVLRASTELPSNLSSDVLQDSAYIQEPELLEGSQPMYEQVRHLVAPSADGAPPSPRAATPPPRIAPPHELDGNGEATMAVIMSMLEAEAGLGGPINYSSLPWPLP